MAGDLPDLVARVLVEDCARTGPGGRPWLSAGGRPGPTSTSMPCATTPRSWSGLSAPAALCAVVKADGYGHGAVPVARAALEGGARWLAVALVEEGVALRQAGIEAPILLLSEPPVEAMAEAVARRLVPTVYTNGGLAAPGRGREAGDRPPVEVHLKVDTGHAPGRGRPGGGAAPGRRHRRSIPGWPWAPCGPIWPWPKGTSPDDRRFTAAQLERFDAVVATLAAAGHRPPMTHVANSAGAIGVPAARHDMVRCGIAVYGVAPTAGPGHRHRAEATGGGRLRPVLSLRSPGDLDARPRRRGAPLLRPAAAAGPALDGGHRAHRLRRRRAPPPLRPGRGGADPRGPPAAGRRGDHGPGGGRLRPGGFGPGGGGGRGGPARAPGRPRRSPPTSGPPARHHQLRGAVRHRSPGPPPDRRGRGGRRAEPGRPAHGPRPPEQYHSAVAPGTDLAALAREAAGCTRCPLSESRTQVVFGVGDPDGRPDVRGRGPRPRRGPAGGALRRPVGQAPRPAGPRGAGRRPVPLLHRQRGQVPAPGQPRPRPDEIAACRPYLEAQLGAHRAGRGGQPRELRHQAAPRHRSGHHQGAGDARTRWGRAGSSPPTTRRRPCARGVWWWPRCGPT